MANLLILLLCAALPGILAQCNQRRAQPFLRRSVYEFAVKLTSRIAQEKENHFVASTLSAWSLLSSASLGADDVTLDEFRKVLRLHRQQCFNDRYFEMIRSVADGWGEVTVERSSTIFVAYDLRLAPTFERRVADAGVSKLRRLSFEDTEAVTTFINDYVSGETHATINDLVTPADLYGVSFVMIDALYFKGPWRTPFPYESTKLEPFYDELGTEIGEVNMMKVMDTFNVTEVDLIGASVLELPFGAEQRFAMLLFLPQQGTTLSAVIDSLMKVSLTTIYVLFAQQEPDTTLVWLPKFDIASDLDNLKELFSDMGLRTAFDPEQAQFPYLAEESLYISNLIQKASVSVTEEGAEASAATAGFFASRSGPETFTLNRPFFYMIVDKHTQVPLFTGAYSKPSASLVL